MYTIIKNKSKFNTPWCLTPYGHFTLVSHHVPWTAPITPPSW